MTDVELDDYVRAFNRRDYAALADRWAPDGIVRFADVVLKGRTAILRFYEFFHRYIDEQIEIEAVACGPRFVATEARVHLCATENLTAAVLQEAGYPSLLPLQKAQAASLHQFIHYRIANGRFVSAVCLIDHQATASINAGFEVDHHADKPRPADLSFEHSKEP